MHGDFPERTTRSAQDDVKSKPKEGPFIGEGPKWEPNKSDVNHMSCFPRRVDMNSSPVSAQSVNMVTLNYSANSANTSSMYPLPSSLHPSYGDSAAGRMNRRRKTLYAEHRGLAPTWEMTSVNTADNNNPVEKCYVGGKGFSRFLQSKLRWRELTADNNADAAAPASNTPSAPFSSQDLIGTYSTAPPNPLRTDADATADLRIGGATNHANANHGNANHGNANHANTNHANHGNLTDREVVRWKSSSQPPPHRSPSQGKEHRHSRGRAEELIAMGTNWNPPPSSSNNNSSVGNLRNGRSHPAASSSSNLLLPVGGGRSKNSSSSVTTRGALLGGATASRHLSKHDDAIRYSDPLPGAPLSFQQRLAELSSLEQETIRYEKSRKLKKKVKDT